MLLQTVNAKLDAPYPHTGRGLIASLVPQFNNGTNIIYDGYGLGNEWTKVSGSGNFTIDSTNNYTRSGSRLTLGLGDKVGITTQSSSFMDGSNALTMFVFANVSHGTASEQNYILKINDSLYWHHYQPSRMYIANGGSLYTHQTDVNYSSGDHWYAFAYDGDTGSFELVADGNSVKTGTTGTADVSNFGGYLHRSSISNYAFIDYVYDARVYNRKMTLTEIQSVGNSILV